MIVVLAVLALVRWAGERRAARGTASATGVVRRARTAFGVGVVHGLTVAAASARRSSSTRFSAVIAARPGVVTSSPRSRTVSSPSCARRPRRDGPEVAVPVAPRLVHEEGREVQAGAADLPLALRQEPAAALDVLGEAVGVRQQVPGRPGLRAARRGQPVTRLANGQNVAPVPPAFEATTAHETDQPRSLDRSL